jgi:hypothetical protein
MPGRDVSMAELMGMEMPGGMQMPPMNIQFSGKATGSRSIDVATGWVKNLKGSSEMQGTLKAMGQEMPITVKSTREITVMQTV